MFDLLFAKANASASSAPSWPGRLVLPVFMIALAACGRAPATDEPVANADPQRGKALITEYGCVACHTIPGIAGYGSNVGPPLAHMARRAYIGGVLPNQPPDMVRWLMDPPQVDPRTAMPNTGLSEAEARDVAAYLYTLE